MCLLSKTTNHCWHKVWEILGREGHGAGWSCSRGSVLLGLEPAGTAKILPPQALVGGLLHGSSLWCQEPSEGMAVCLHDVWQTQYHDMSLLL